MVVATYAHGLVSGQNVEDDYFFKVPQETIGKAWSCNGLACEGKPRPVAERRGLLPAAGNLGPATAGIGT